MKFRIYWTNKTREEFPEIVLVAENKSEASILGKKEALKILNKEYKYRIGQRKIGDMIPKMKKPSLSDIKILDVDEE